jgi:hypothetical protein
MTQHDTWETVKHAEVGGYFAAIAPDGKAVAGYVTKVDEAAKSITIASGGAESVLVFPDEKPAPAPAPAQPATEA